MSLLPTVGTVSYNGYTFNSHTRSSVTGRMVYDEAGRTVVAVEYLLTVSSFIHESSPGAGCDAQVLDARRRLTKPGQELQYVSNGFGGLAINVSQNESLDVAWGPRPVLVRLEPVGSRACWAVEWQCVVTVPECSGAAYRDRPMAFNYAVDFDVDTDGYTTRTYTGYVEVPMTRVAGGRTVPDTADKYRERIKIPVPAGFQRTRQSFGVSPDKRRLTFTITDRQLPDDGLPWGCTGARGRFRVSSNEAGAVNFVVTLSATYRVARGKSRALAWEAFYALLTDRLRKAGAPAADPGPTLGGGGRVTEGGKDITGGGPTPPTPPAGPGPDGSSGREPVVIQFEAEEGLYEDAREVSFTAAYTLIGSIDTILQESGLWRPVPNTEYRQWAASIGDAAGLRGHAKLKDRAADDLIVDLCGTGLPGPGEATMTRAPDDGGDTASLKGSGWVDYQLQLDAEKESGWMPTKLAAKVPEKDRGGSSLRTKPSGGATLGGRGGVTEGGRDVTGDGVPGMPTAAGADLAARAPRGGAAADRPRPTAQGNKADAIQARTTPSYYLRLRGYGVRIGAPVPCPAVTSLRGAKVVPDPDRRQYYAQKVIGRLLGRPVFHAEWVLPYFIRPDRAGEYELPELGAPRAWADGSNPEFGDPPPEFVPY